MPGGAGEGRKLIGRRAQVTAGVSTFIPKPHTPFQWVPCDTIEQIRAKQDLLQARAARPGSQAQLERPRGHPAGSLAVARRPAHGRGDLPGLETRREVRRLEEHFRYDLWLQAFAEQPAWTRLSTPTAQRPLDEIFPWEHISTTVRKKFLTEDYLWSLQGKTRVDCRERCFACGILPTFADLRRQNPGEVWQCPEVKSKRIPVQRSDRLGSRIVAGDLMQRPMRVRITFAKTDAMRFTGHLDLHRAWERTFRRAGLPLAYTQGFSPHPRINLASALPLGFTSERELVDIWLEQELPASAVTAALERLPRRACASRMCRSSMTAPPPCRPSCLPRNITLPCSSRCPRSKSAWRSCSPAPACRASGAAKTTTCAR